MGILRTVAVFLALTPLAFGAGPRCLSDLLPGVEAEARVAAGGASGEKAPETPRENPRFDAFLFSSSAADGRDAAGAKRPAVTPPQPDPKLAGTEKNFIHNVIYDQKAIWTSPFKLKAKDARWLVPFGAITGGLLYSDARAMQLEQSPASAISRSDNVANGGVAALGGVALGLYAWGKINDNPHAREAGILSAEAVTNSLIVTGFLKVVTLRDRPDVANGRGDFFSTRSPLAASFPSQHTVMAWAAASVIAREYPGWVTQLGVYSAAAAVSVARVSGRKHFPSDVVVGSAIGWLIGRQVYKAHHDPDLGGENIGVFTPGEGRPAAMGSTYVPLDSWVYPALLRLAAMGYIGTQLTNMQPWTRLECVRQIQEARTTLESRDDPPEAVGAMIAQLEREFAREREAVQADETFQELALESVYFRYTNISGTPLRDSFHFGQTQVNDFGRPFGEGNNVVTGVSARAVDGRFSYYFRGEYQHAPGAPAAPLNVRQFISGVDQLPLSGANPVDTIDRLRLVEGYMGVTLGDFNVTFGKQSLWWGPGRGGPLILSNNAEPMYMFRISNMHPFRLPGVFKYLGDIKGEFFFGKLAGHNFPARPYLHGQKITLKLTPNLEVGFSRTVTFAGRGHSPFTLGTFATSFFSVGDQLGSTSDPGDRHGQFDFSYRVPKLRNWLTVYSDSYADDDPSPLAAPRRAAFNPGFYVSHLPGLPRVDLRAESVYTDVPALNGHGGFIYWNFVYHNGYTSDGSILGSWIGRQGKGFQVWTTYWHSAQSTVQAGWRNAKISTGFVPGGGTQNDIFANANIFVRPDVSISGLVQREAWLIPLVKPGLQHDWSASIQVTIFPKLKKRGRSSDGRGAQTP